MAANAAPRIATPNASPNDVSFRYGFRSRLVPTRANGQPAFGRYLSDPHTPVTHAHWLIVLTPARPTRPASGGR